MTIVLGDRREGAPGIRAQIFQESNYEFRLLVDPTNAALVRRLPTSPVLPVIAGEAVELVCLLPTQAGAGEAVEIFVKGQDAWGNPTPAPVDLKFRWEGDGEAQLGAGQLRLSSPGNGFLWVTTADGTMSCRSNPITFFEEKPVYSRYWGDLHGQTKATVGTGSEDEYFSFGRDVARLDFMSHQGNDFQISDDFWRHLNETTRRYNEEGRFVVFPGYEWSANTPAGGDWNVFYREEGQPIFRSSHWQVPNVPEDRYTPAHPADVLFERLREHVDPRNVLLAAHVGGRYANVRRYFEPLLARLVEVVSDWGVFEWILWDALEKGYIVGVMGNSDGHRCRPGAEAPGASEFGISNGLTCVLAESLTRDAVFDALQARRCYATTGTRIDLDFQATTDGRSFPMGSIIETGDQVTCQARVTGTGPLESLTLYRGKEAVETVRPPAFDAVAGSGYVRVSWRGSRMRGRGRRAVWDGRIELEGTEVLSAETVSFDAVTDGIRQVTPGAVSFASSTTGDTDGIELQLSQAHQGAIRFVSGVGERRVDLSQLGHAETFDMGGLDMALRIERYPAPAARTATSLQLHAAIIPEAGERLPYLVKAVQCDGEMAWSSPIYIRGR